MAKVQIIETEQSITLNIPGNGLFQVMAGSVAYDKVKQLQKNRDYAAISTFMNVPARLEAYAKGKFVIIGGEIFFKGDAIPSILANRVLQFCEQDIDPTPLMRFWDNLKRNPSESSREDLFSFLEHNGISITSDGCFVGYKRVDDNFMDLYSHSIRNKPGDSPAMDREAVDQDRNNTCSKGLHVAAYDYANEKYYGNCGRLVEVKVNPADVVCVPPDYDQEKMRCCKYTVIRECPEEYKKALYEHDDSYDRDDDYDYEADTPNDDFDDDSNDDSNDDSVVRSMILTADRHGRMRIPAEFIKLMGVVPGEKVCCFRDCNTVGIYLSHDNTMENTDVLYVVDQYFNVRVNLKQFDMNESKMSVQWDVEDPEYVMLKPID